MRCEGERVEGPQAEEGPRGMSAREVRALALPDGSVVEVCSLAGDIRAFPNHLHDHYVVGVLHASRRALTVSSRELHVLEPGDVFLVNPGEPHACDPLDDEPFSYRCANVPASTEPVPRRSTNTCKTPITAPTTATPRSPTAIFWKSAANAPSSCCSKDAATTT